MGFDLNFTELKKFSQITGNFPKDFQKFLEKFLMEMAEKVISKTKPRTPVDTGALRNAWEISSIKGKGHDIYVELNNPMEYASYIEYGHRIVSGSNELGWYEGKFMLKTSIDEVRAQMPLRYERELKRFCKEHGID